MQGTVYRHYWQHFIVFFFFYYLLLFFEMFRGDHQKEQLHEELHLDGISRSYLFCSFHLSYFSFSFCFFSFVHVYKDLTSVMFFLSMLSTNLYIQNLFL